MVEKNKPVEKVKYIEDEKKLETILRASMQNYKDKDLVDKVVRYMITQFNSEAFIGNLGFAEYASIMRKTKDSLYVLIFVANYDKDYLPKYPIFWGCLNLSIELLSRMHKGLDYKRALKALEAQGGLIFTKLTGSKD